MKSLFKNKELNNIKTRLRAIREKISNIDNSIKKTKQSELRDNQKNNQNNEFEETIQEETTTRIQQTATDKKEQLKKQILQIIKHENLTGGEVKQKIVDQARRCSKATYYRYIQELKKSGEIESITINNQEFLYSKK